MKHLKKIRSIALCVFLALSLSACSKEAKQSNPLPEDSAASADFAVSESAPEEGGKDTIECQTHEVPVFGIAFDCPTAFGTEGESKVVAEDEINYSIDGGDKGLVLMCSRISSLSRAEELLVLAGKDPSILYEDFERLDLADEIISWSGMYQTFNLLDSFSTPESYGFSYTAADDSFGALITELGYRYKNYGGFVDDGGIIRIVLIVTAPEDTDREDFFTLCETVTNSIRFSEPKAGDSVAQDTAEELHDSSYEEFPVYGEHLPEEADELPLEIEAYEKRNTHLNAPELQYTYGTNSQIPDDLFQEIIQYIQAGDQCWAQAEYTSASIEKNFAGYDYGMDLDSAIDAYEAACLLLEASEYTDTPLYDYVNRLCVFGPYLG